MSKASFPLGKGLNIFKTSRFLKTIKLTNPVFKILSLHFQLPSSGVFLVSLVERRKAFFQYSIFGIQCSKV